MNKRLVNEGHRRLRSAPCRCPSRRNRASSPGSIKVSDETAARILIRDRGPKRRRRCLRRRRKSTPCRPCRVRHRQEGGRLGFRDGLDRIDRSIFRGDHMKMDQMGKCRVIDLIRRQHARLLDPVGVVRADPKRMRRRNGLICRRRMLRLRCHLRRRGRDGGRRTRSEEQETENIRS